MLTVFFSKTSKAY